MLLLNENNGFSYEEMLRMPFEILLGFFNVKEKILEERKKAEEEAQDEQQGHVPSVSSMMAQAKSSFKMPSSSSFNIPHYR